MSEKNQRKYLQQLARKVLAGKATEEEKLFLEEYYNAFEDHADIQAELTADELQNLQQAVLQQIHNRIMVHEMPRRPWYKRWRQMAAAAVLLLAVGTTIPFLINKKDAAGPTDLSRTAAADVLPGGNKATLTLHDGATIVLDEMGEDSLVKQDAIQVRKTADGQLVYTVADNPSSTAAVAYNTVTTPRGGQYQVVLPDGTRVWLNAASSIHFPTRFTQQQRSVSITGEVYFEVSHKPSRPFVVTAGETTVQVLGTHFNVMAYPDETVVKTTLAEGSVKIAHNGRSALLRPGEQIQVNERRFEVQPVDVEAELAWKNGLFNFKEEGIETVMRQVERWYDINVRYEGILPEKQFTGKVSRSVTLSELMEILSFYDDMKCLIDGNTVTIRQYQPN